MSIIIDSDRLRLRKFEPNDAEHLLALNANPEVVKYTGDPPFDDIIHARAFVANYEDYDQHGMGRWAVIRKSDDEWIGWCGLKQHTDFVDLGFRFFEHEWGKGYATESALLSLKYGFEHLTLDEIVGRSMPQNKASIKVLEKLGMVYQKTDHCNGLHDAEWYSIKRLHWLNQGA